MTVESGRFADRAAAGRELAGLLKEYERRPDAVVLGLPRGGVPVAAEVASGLGLPLDVLVVRKLGVPGQEELAMGAIASGGVRVLNRRVINGLGIDEAAIDRVAAEEGDELDRRARVYRDGRPPLDVAGKVVIVVDDGLATGSTMRAAVAALRSMGPAEVVVAVPVGAPPTCEEIGAEADALVCARTPSAFEAVGQWYDNFSPPSEDRIRELLAGSVRRRPRPAGLLELYNLCVAWTGKVISGIRDDQLELATPCPDWDVRTLAGHVISVNRVYESAARACPLGPDLDLANDSAADIAAAYDASAAAAGAALSRPGLLDETLQLPIGGLSGELAVSLAFLDNLVHGWDLAKATGQDTAMEPELAGAGLDLARRLVTDEFRAAGAFGPPIPVADDEPIHDRLAGFLGRTP